MELELTDEQALLVDTVDRFLADNISTRDAREFADEPAPDATGTFAALAELGLLGIVVPESHGGGGGGMLELALVAELLGEHCAPGAFIEHVVATAAVAWAGTDDQRARWLPGLAAGTVRATVAAMDGSWLEPAESRAIVGDARHEWVLHPSGADLLVVCVDGSLAIVDLRELGVLVEPVIGYDLTRRLGTVVLDCAQYEPLTGGAVMATRVRDAALVLIAADAIGGARHCVARTASYVKEREQFGVSIAHFQGVKHQFADMAVDVEPARYLVWSAASGVDEELAEAARLAAVAKSHACDRFVAAARTSVELHGGIGYTWECDLHLYLRRAVFDRSYLGAPSVHRRRAADLADWSGARSA